MANYNDLATISGQSGWDAFMEKVITAVRIKAAAIIDQTAPTVDALAWANEVLSDARAEANRLVWYMIAVNASASIAVILAAPDTGEGSVQKNIDSAVDAIYGAGS